MRSVSLNNEAREQQQRSAQNTPTPWDGQTVRDRPRSRESNSRTPQRDSRESQSQRDSKESQRERIERYGSGSGSSRQQHGRNGSSGTAPTSSQGDYGTSGDSQGGRRHDYDVQSMETDLSSPRASMARNPIPPPLVTVRSEYPTLSRSRQSQTLTCLITIEVPEGKWSPDPGDLRGAPPLPPLPQEKEVVRSRSPSNDRQRDWVIESPETLEQITEDLRVRVDNWHGLDFSRYVFILDPPLHPGSVLMYADLANYDYTAQSVSAETANHGKNWNAFSLPRCLYASRRKRALCLSMRMATPSASLQDAL